ncbi:MAG: phospholipase D-like domain-containing protein [Pseudomonadota bacterium]
MTDAARGRRRLDVDADGRPAALVDAEGVALAFTHDGEGNLRRIASGDWFVAIDGPAPEQTFAVADPAGSTRMLLTGGGRVRTLTRGADCVSIEFDSLERVRRVTLPGSVNALIYEWDEEGGCVVRAEGGGPLLTLSDVGRARRVALGRTAWWEEEIGLTRARLRAAVDGAVCDTLDIRLADLAVIAERRWSNGSGDSFERDARGRLSAWTQTDAGGGTTVRHWRYAEGDLAEDSHGVRTLGEGGRVLALGDRVGYRYDAAGRRITRTGDGADTRYFYDPLGTLAGVETAAGGMTRFETDGMGRRVATRRSGRGVRHEHRDEVGRLWAVTDESGRALHAYIWIGDRIAARVDGAIGAPVAEAYLCDPLGTPNGVLIASDGGWRFERLEAPPYGRTDNAARPTLYSHFGDPETGLIHFGARDLDPELGLFLTPDPWHGGADDPRRWAGATDAMIARDSERPGEGFHDYALCRFDPLGRYDRDGHASGGDIALHVIRFILMSTWGFPLTAVSVYFFEPFNLYAELAGLLIWACSQCAEDKSHLWGHNTIAQATGVLGSERQFTFAAGLNGFLPRVVTGRALNGDRAVTIGNVIWISRGELHLLERVEVVEVVDIAAPLPLLKFNDDPSKESRVALVGSDKDGKQRRLHVSAWTRGMGNAVAMRALAPPPGPGPGPGPAPVQVQSFTDVAVAGAPAVSAIHLLHPAPYAMPLPRDAASPNKLEIREYVRATTDPWVDMEVVADVWFSLQLPKDTKFVVGEWLRISAPEATPKPAPVFRRIRELLPAADHAAVILNAELPARFQAAKASAELRIELAKVDGAAASPGWTGAAATLTLVPTAPATSIVPPDFAVGSVVQIVSDAPDAAPMLAGVALGLPEGTSFSTVKEIRVKLTLAPDAAGAAAGAKLRRAAPSGVLFHGVVAKQADTAKIVLTAPFPAIAKDDLLVISVGGADPAYVRATAAPASGVLSIDPALPAAMVPADASKVDLQLTKASGDDGDTATATAVAGAAVDAALARAGIFAAGNLVRVEAGGVAALRRVEAIPQMQVDLDDPPAGVAGKLVLTRAAIATERSLSDVQLAPPGRFLKKTGFSGVLGDWPAKLLSIELHGIGASGTENGAHYVHWAGGARPGDFHDDFHHVWTWTFQGAVEYMVLETPLPIIRRKDSNKVMQKWWRVEPDDDAGGTDVLITAPSPLKLRAREFSAGAVRADADGRRVLACEPETLVPESPTVHDTHRRALIEHEIHHTVQCNFWGPMMGALPLQGFTMSVFDLVGGAGKEIPDWLHHVDRDASGNPPADAAGRIHNNTELNPLEVFSIGGILQLSWKYAFLWPFHAFTDGPSDKIAKWDFEGMTKYFNPASRLVTQAMPQVDPNAPAGTRWLQVLGQSMSRALDLRSWTPFLGFVPFLLPDGPTNFIEQGASRASGDLYSTILTANNRYNLHTCGRWAGSTTDLDADLHSPAGQPVRLLLFGGYRSDRVLESTAADVPGKSLTYRQGRARTELFKITLPDVGDMLFSEDLYEVRPRAGAAKVTVSIEGPGPLHTPTDFILVSHGDTVVPRLRAMTPLPPRVNRASGFYLIAGHHGRLTIEAPHPAGRAPDDDPQTETATLTIVDEVKLGEETIGWTMPAVVGALPALPATLKRYETEESVLKIRVPKDSKPGAFVDSGIFGFKLDISDATVVSEELKEGWKLTMPVTAPMAPPVGGAAALPAPVRLRIFRVVEKTDPAFDLAFSDVPSIQGIRSYLDKDVFTVIRDVHFEVEVLPVLPPKDWPWDTPFELKLPIKLFARERGIIITPPPGVTAPPVSFVGDDGRGEKWNIGPLAEPPGDDAKFQVEVTYGRPDKIVSRKFELTFKPAIKLTGASFDVLPGTPLDIAITGGKPPYTRAFDPPLPGLDGTLSAGKISVLANAAPEAVTEVKMTVTDSTVPAKIGVRRISVKNMPPILLPADSADYFDYVRPATRGLATPLINGRSSGGAGPNVDLTEPLDAMERAVKALGKDDALYISSWFFGPATKLTAGGLPGVTTWGQLLAKKATEDVRISMLINDFDPISKLDQWLAADGLEPLNKIIDDLPVTKRDNLKYIVCMHPAHLGKLKAAIAGQGFNDIYVASHHQKFMIARKGKDLTAFCGGVDIERSKSTETWDDVHYGGWHDIHLQLEGPITRDLEREFVERWNRSRPGSRPAHPGWGGFEGLVVTPLSPADDVPAKKVHLLQMTRTVSDDGVTSLYSTKRDDIKQTYRRAIQGAKQFLYLENQYFRSTELADWIVAAGTADPLLTVIMVVIGAAEDGKNALTEHGDFLQFQTFDRIHKGLGARAEFYTMYGRSVHSKFLTVDDAWMTIGSANANVRSFELDSELNVQIADPALTKAFRTRLWARNLGETEAAVGGWAPADFLAHWKTVATANTGKALTAMAGAGIIPFDYTKKPGVEHGIVPDALVRLDFGKDGGHADPNAPPDGAIA